MCLTQNSSSNKQKMKSCFFQQRKILLRKGFIFKLKRDDLGELHLGDRHIFMRQTLKILNVCNA